MHHPQRPPHQPSSSPKTLDLRPAAISDVTEKLPRKRAPWLGRFTRIGRLSRRHVILAATGIVVGAVAVTTGWVLTHQPLTLPADVARHVLFPAYVPSALPVGYTIATDSYDTRQGVLLFHATDQAGHTVVFSEQAKPQNYDIGNFQQRLLNNSYSLPGAPYPSVIGKTDQGGMLLSVVTNDTWLIITSSAPNATANLNFIAQRLYH